MTRLGVKLFGTDNQQAIDKARRELGYRPLVSLHEGISLAAAWFLSQSQPGTPPAGAVAEQPEMT